MWTRRSVLRLAGSATGAAFAARSYGIDYVAAATAAVENRSPGELGARVVEVLDAMARSAATGQRVEIAR